MKRRISEVVEGDWAWERKTKRHVTEEDYGAGETSRRLQYPSKDRPAAPVPFQQPSQLLSFSYTPARELEFNDSALRYYAQPPPTADLRYGYERWIKRPEERGRLDGLLKAVAKHRSRIDASGASGDAWLRDISVVSWRGVMTKILTAPYEERDAWEMNVMSVNGTIYLEEHLSQAKLAEKEDMTPHHRLQSYYGYSFESFCTSSFPDRRDVPAGNQRHVDGWGGDVNTNVQWCSVVKTKLGNDRLVIGGEVDCVRGRYTGKGDTDTFVELKTSLNIRRPQDEAKFEKKLLKFYFQSFLLGVPEIIVGFRKPSGQLTTVQSFQTIQLPRLVRGKPGAWDPSVCLKWGEQFIRFLKSTVPESNSQSSSGSDTQDPTEVDLKLTVWRVKFVPGTGVSVNRLDKAGVQDIEAGEERIGFLPKWYLNELGVSSAQDFSSQSLADDNDAEPPPAQAEPSPDISKADAVPPIPAGWNI